MKTRFIKGASLAGMFVALGVGLSGCAGGLDSLSLPGSGSSSSQQPVGGGISTSAGDVANAGSIVDTTTQIVLSNPKKITGYCPSVDILPETNVFQSFEKGKTGDANALRYQAVINQSARECTTLGAEMYIKVGVAGRVLAGPKGGSGKVVLPLRIVVKQRSEVLYTRLHKIPVDFTPPERAAMFAKVDEEIAIATPAERNVQILIGFDTTSGKR